MKSKLESAKNVIKLFTFLLIVWGFYRILFQLPEELEEFVIKPVIWLGAVAFMLKKEKKSISSIGITTKKLFPAIYMSLALGAVFAIEALLLNYIKYSSFNFGAYIGPNPFILAFAISIATAISEEIAFRGYIFTRVRQLINKEWSANILTSIGWALIHIPIVIVDWRMPLQSALPYFLLIILFGIGSAWVYARTGNIFSSILLHVLWAWPIALFR